MQTYLIERTIPGAAAFDDAQLRDIATRSCAVLAELGPSVRWRHSFVTGDRFFCVYEAEREELVREHARRGGFPADRILPVARVVGPDATDAPAAPTR